MTYPVASFLTQIKNAYMANLNEVSFPYSKIVLSIGTILKEAGYLKSVKEETLEGRKVVKVTLVYKKNSAAMTDVKIISKPSIHKYVGKNEIKKVSNKYDLVIISTNQGVMTSRKAIELGIGGELLARIS